MKPQALYEYYADKLKTNVSFLRPGEDPVVTGNADDPLLAYGPFVDEILSLAGQEYPSISCLNDHYYYGTIVTDQGVLFVGPIYSTTGIRLGNGLNFKIKEEDLPALPEGSLIDLLETVQALHNFWNDDDLPFDRILYLNFYQEKLGQIVNNRINTIVFQYNEANESHGSYAIERRLVHAIRSGDMKMVMESTQENVHGKHGVVDENELENAKKLSIVGITIASRAAIEGGVHFEVALSLTDSYFHQLNSAKSMGEIETIVFQCNEHLARLVQERRAHEARQTDTSASYYSEKAKDFVQSHLHDPLSVQMIADELSVSPNYLSALFKRSEGLSLTRYILQAKISLARSMLLYSAMPYPDIAMYLGFSSQSHFCKVFKDMTGVSPSEYRKQLT